MKHTAKTDGTGFLPDEEGEAKWEKMQWRKRVWLGYLVSLSVRTDSWGPVECRLGLGVGKLGI